MPSIGSRSPPEAQAVKGMRKERKTSEEFREQLMKMRANPAYMAAQKSTERSKKR